ncbi:hypothetical protein GGR50DRAFT_686241 [Xylaria sp. CBS 124048]|nr:hypothetical protein GGR50DRAFT_686241 [Xylaria sp. CBS 124048]
MANGFVKLERLFSGSRRRDRVKQRLTQERQKTGTGAAQRPSSPVFPAPSYLKPTSTNMMPRDAQTDRPEAEKGRSRSLPSLQEALHKRSSATSSITVVDNRLSRCDAFASSRRSRRISRNQRSSSHFRFTEDSPFKDEHVVRSSGTFHKKVMSRELSPRARDIGHSLENGLLDWTPKHISLLFNPLEFCASSNDHSWGSRSSSTGSTLLPSPVFAPSTVLANGRDSIDDSSQLTGAHPLTQSNSPQKLMAGLRRYSCMSHGSSAVQFSTPSNDNSGAKPPICRSLSLSNLALSRPNATGFPTSTGRNLRRARTAREPRDKRLTNPGSTDSLKSSNETISPPNLRNSESIPSLSDLSSQTSQDRVLKEPTFDDFYALSDDDIAESRPSTPANDLGVPPPPPPKDIEGPSNSFEESYPLRASRHIRFASAREVSQSYSKTNYHLLPLIYSPTTRRDTDGALRAAQLAKKYDFAVLYVLSLWPVDSNRCPTTARHSPASPPPSRSTTSHISGRLLAAYGLNNVPSPFEIVTDTHLAALNCNRWNEYRNIDACTDDIARGWIRPFYSDYAPISSPLMITGNNPEEPRKNRGVVFAAYSKHTLKPVIPMRASPHQRFVLQQLYSDAKALVETLVSEPRKGTSSEMQRPRLHTC